jgi:hypothetical protein
MFVDPLKRHAATVPAQHIAIAINHRSAIAGVRSIREEVLRIECARLLNDADAICTVGVVTVVLELIGWILLEGVRVVRGVNVVYFADGIAGSVGALAAWDADNCFRA